VFWAYFLQISVLRIAFSKYLCHFRCFNVLLKACWACFYENLLILSCFIGFAFLTFYFIFLLIFRFVEFSCQACWADFSVKLPIFGLFFKFTSLFLQNNVSSPADFHRLDPNVTV